MKSLGEVSILIRWTVAVLIVGMSSGAASAAVWTFDVHNNGTTVLDVGTDDGEGGVAWLLSVKPLSVGRLVLDVSAAPHLYGNYMAETNSPNSPEYDWSAPSGSPG